MQCLQATKHQGAKEFQNGGKQCAANSLCAMTLSLKKSIDTWSSNDLDLILYSGESLYNKIGSSSYLLISDLPETFDKYEVKVLRSYSGTVDRKATERPFYSLEDAVSELEQFCFITLDCYTVGVIKQDNYIYVFDPHSRNECGMPSPNGKTVLTRHDNLMQVCTFLRHLCAFLFKDKAQKVFFEVTHVSVSLQAVKHIENTCFENSINSSSSFSGFSEVSEGEYTCILYLLKEKEKELNNQTMTYSSETELSMSEYEPEKHDLNECSSLHLNNFESDKENSPLDNQSEEIIENTLSSLNDSSAFIQSINLEAFDQSDLSDSTLNYDITENSGDVNAASSTDEEIPLSFVSKKSKFMKKKKELNNSCPEHVDSNHEAAEVEISENTGTCTDDVRDRCRSRKKVRKESEWKRNVAKQRRNEGKSYINKHGKEKGLRKIKQACGLKCRFKCVTHFTETEREKLFHNFWKTGNITKQRQFLVQCVTRKPKSKNKLSLPRRFAFQYKLPTSIAGVDVRVCKLFFLNTFGISQSCIYTAHKKLVSGLPGVVSDERRGTSASSRWNSTSDESLSNVRNHIESFPTVDSHYCRKNSKRQYLHPGLSIVKMYSLYCEVCDKNDLQPKVSIQVYRKVFNTEFNYGFHKPRNDQCDFCTAFKNATNKDKGIMLTDYNKHIRNKTTIQKIKDSDKNLAKMDKSIVVACFDLEEVLVTPKAFESSLYYKRRLNSFNFTIYNLGNSEVHSYLWNETIAGRGASEIASAVYSFIKQKSEMGHKKFIFYSDNCSAQNKNRFYFTMIWYCVQKFNLISIQHKYLEKGHTYNENDSVHAGIERQSRYLSVYTTSQWAAIIRATRPKKPYKVHEMSLNDFFDFKQLSECLKNFDLNDARQKVYLSEIKHFSITLSDPNMYLYKYNHDSEEFGHVNLLSRLRRCTDCPNPKMIKLLQLRNEPIRITGEKYNDLISLCLSRVIPKPNHIFYALLPHNL